MKFVAHHLWDPSKREIDPDMGCPRTSPRACRRRGLLRCDGPHAPNTQAAPGELEHIAPLERDRGTVRSAESALGAAIGRSDLAAAAPAQEQAGRHSGCPGSADRDLRDGSSSRCPGPRDPSLGVRVRRAPAQRSGAAARRAARDEPPARLDPRDREIARVAMPRNSARPDQDGRRRRGGQGASGRPSGRGAGRMAGAGRHQEGADLPGDRPWEAVEEKALTPQSINLIVKRRCAMAGLEPEAFSAHGLRAGYLTEAARQGIGLPEAMQQSQHRSVQQAASYYNEADARRAGRQGWGFDRAVLKVACRKLLRFCIQAKLGLSRELTSRLPRSARSGRRGSRKLPAGNFS